MFRAWGDFVYRFRRVVLLCSIVLFALSGVAIVRLNTPLNSSDRADHSLEALRAADLIDQELPSDGGASFTLIFADRDARRLATDPTFASAVEAALQPLRDDPRVTGINQSPTFVSRDRRRLFVVVTTRDGFSVAGTYYEELRAKVQSDQLTIQATGALPLNHDFAVVSEEDLRKAEFTGLPIALAILLAVFGATLWRTVRRSSLRGAGLALALTVGALALALIPILVGLLAISGGLAGVYALAHRRTMSIYALNIASMIGLGVAIDYSLFIISRFLEESMLRPQREALARTVATSGRAIAFSGLTVAIGVSGLLFYHSSMLTSIGLSAMLVVGAAVFYGLTFLPALLAVAGDTLLALARRRRGVVAPAMPEAQQTSAGFWHLLTHGVMRRPWLVLIPTLTLLLLAGSPFLRLRIGSPNATVLPERAESRQAWDILTSEFPGGETTPIPVVVAYPDRPLTAERVGALYDYAHWLSGLPHVSRVQSPVTLTGPDGQPLSREQTIQLLTTPPREQLPKELQEGLRRSVGEHIVVLTVLTPAPADSDVARDLVRTIRASASPGPGSALLVGGESGFIIDQIASLQADTKWAVLFIMVATSIVLFLLLGSVLLPLKAVVMNLLSISASYGALVWIFQEGHLSGPLNFTPGSIEATVPVLMFCLLFGLSMDYEVLLLSRMKEEYDQHADNRAAVVAGLEQTGRLITGAAGIMIAVFAAFALADIVIIKSIGLGMALAVAIDALVVRMLVVPATMRLLGDWNWWAPAPLARLYQRLGLAERSSATPPVYAATAAIRSVHAGGVQLDPAVASRVVAEFSRLHADPPGAATETASASDAAVEELTPREREVLRLLSTGASNREIADQLFISEGTVKNHISNILSRLGLRDRTQAALFAKEHGLIMP